MALLPRRPGHGVPKGNRIWQAGDPEPPDHPNVISLSRARFHRDAQGWYRCGDDDGPRVPWMYLPECYVLVAEDVSECAHTKNKDGAT